MPNGGLIMKDNYDISKLNPRKNPYTEKLKRQVTMNLRITTIDYFKQLAEETGISYQNLILISLYQRDFLESVKKSL
jgi:predicted DNA binding CopG/RHH family protein